MLEDACVVGHGHPVPALVEAARAGLRGECPLPPSSALSGWPDLKASAACALDLEAPVRLAAVFHADDPTFLASSRGALSATIEVVCSWAFTHKARLHTGGDKSVVMVAGPEAARSAAELAPPIQIVQPGVSTPALVKMVRRQRLLGLLWPADLDFLPALMACINTAEGVFKELASLVAARAIPLATAVQLFETKVDSILFFGRWLWMDDLEMQNLESTFNRWAKTLLGGDPWRNDSVATGEMGWSLSGSARVVLDVALRKARVLQLDEGDYYKLITTITVEGTNSWSNCSSKLLYSWGVAEWTHHLATHQVYGRYKEYVKCRLAEACKPKWAAMAAAHKAEIPYLSIQDGPSSALVQIRTLPFPWRIQTSIRSWCRARAGYIAYRDGDGHYSRAKLQICISCDRMVSHGCVHTFGHCPA